MKEAILTTYEKLLQYYGPQHWWPGEGLEIAVGAILTQQTNWKNVETALEKLKEANCMSVECLKRIPLYELEQLIRSSGYYRVKARRLKNLVNLLDHLPLPSREDFLAVKGMGYETVDSILLYWFEKPYFVVDSYTFRILERLGIYRKQNYLELQKLFMKNIPKDIKLYKEYHALIVKHAKEICLKKNPKCDICPLKKDCSYYKKYEN